MDPRKRSLYVWEWQLLRVDLDFSTIESTMKSMKACEDFLFRNGTATAPDYYRVITQYASIVSKLFKQLKKISKRVDKGSTDIRTYLPINKQVEEQVTSLKQRIQLIQIARGELNNTYTRMAKNPRLFPANNRARVAELRIALTDDLLKVHKSLASKWVVAKRRNVEHEHPELAEYLVMLEEELEERQATFPPAGVSFAEKN